MKRYFTSINALDFRLFNKKIEGGAAEKVWRTCESALRAIENFYGCSQWFGEELDVPS